MDKTDAIVGEWKVLNEATKGVKEYYDAFCKPEEAANYAAHGNDKITITITKTGDNQYKSVVDVAGIPPVTETFVIGGKSSLVFPGFGAVQADTCLEGDKIVCTANVGGVQMRDVLFVDGDCLVVEKGANGITMFGRSRRV